MGAISDLIFFKYRGRLVGICLAALFLAVVFSAPSPWGNVYVIFFMELLAWFFFVIYLTFRIWSTLYIGGKKNRDLQNEGPYSITRNPLYVANFCFLLSAALFLGSISLVAAAAGGMLIYSQWVIKSEEAALSKTFGSAYDDYVKRTPRLIPRFSSYRASPTVEVNLWSLKLETKRLWRASLLPIAAKLLVHVKSAPWWPHWFILP